MGIKKAIKRVSKIEETSITAIISSFTNNNFQVDRQTQKDQDNEIYYYSLRLLRDMSIYFKSNWDRDIPDIPAELVEHILFGYTFPGDKVYDPFGDFMVARMVKDKKRVLVATSQEKEN